MSIFQLDFFVYTLILMLVIGAGFILASAILNKENNLTSDNQDEGLVSLAKKINTLESSVTEADEAVGLLDDMSKTVFKELDNKYQELLFLYNLIDEKQKSISKPGSSPQMPENYTPRFDFVAGAPKKAESGFVGNPKIANVLRLSAKGLSVDEIAKQLDMGKGEISLILNLSSNPGGPKNA